MINFFFILAGEKFGWFVDDSDQSSYNGDVFFLDSTRSFGSCYHFFTVAKRSNRNALHILLLLFSFHVLILVFVNLFKT